MKDRENRGARRGTGSGFSGKGNCPEDMERAGAGPDGFCECPSCMSRYPHKKGVPCSSEKCPQCGVSLVRGQD